MNPELSEADLCRIEANYGDKLSALEKALITELRLVRELADANEGAADKVVELERELEDARDDAKDLRNEKDDLERQVLNLEGEVKDLRRELDA